MGKKWTFIRTPVKQWKNYTQVWEKKKEKKVEKRKKNVEIYEHASETMERKNPFTTRLEAVYIGREKKVGKKEEKLALNEPSFNGSFGFFPLIFPPRAYTASSLVAMSYG